MNFCCCCSLWQRPKPPTPTHACAVQRQWQRQQLLGCSERKDFSHSRLSLPLLYSFIHYYSWTLAASIFFPLTCHLLNITFNFCSSHGAVKCVFRSFLWFVCSFSLSSMSLFPSTPFFFALTIFNVATARHSTAELKVCVYVCVCVAKLWTVVF